MPISTYMLVVNEVANRLYLNRPDLGDGSDVRVFRRKTLKLLEEDVKDPETGESLLPCVVVAPGSQGEQVGIEGFGGVVVYLYPVAVGIYAKGNELGCDPMDVAEQVTNDARQELRNIQSLHEWVRQQLYQPTLAGAPTVFNVDLAVGPVIEATGREGAMYDVSACVATYWSLESRLS